jgi:hypothetical protein
MYDKLTCEWARAAIARVAQEREYYDEATEEALRGVETPGHQALQRFGIGRPSPSRNAAPSPSTSAS